MAVDIPFKTPLEVSEAISLLETKFADRYTEQDPSYSRVVEGGQRWRNVPVMHPWPPRRPRQRGAGGGGRRHGYYDNRDYRERRHYDDYHERRRPHRSPPPTHWSPPPHGSSPPNYPHFPEYPHRQSPPPHPHPLTPSPHSNVYLPSPHHQEGDNHAHKISVPSTPPPSSPVLQAPPIFAGSPVLQAPPTPSGLISAEESDINPSEPEPVVEKKSAAFYIGTLGNLGNTKLKPLPTESDVNDILSLAHGGHTVSTLKQAKHSPPHPPSGKHKRGDKQIKKQKQSNHNKQTATSNNLQISHGQSVDVAPGEIFESNKSKQKRKHPIIPDVDSSSDSDVDVTGTHSRPLTVSVKREIIYQPGLGAPTSVYFSGETGWAGLKGDDSSSNQQRLPLSISRKSALSVLSEFTGTSSNTTSISSNFTGILASGPVATPKVGPDASELGFDAPSGNFTQTLEAGFHGDGHSITHASQLEASKKKKKKKKKKKVKEDDQFVSTVIDDGTRVKLQVKLQ